MAETTKAQGESVAIRISCLVRIKWQAEARDAHGHHAHVPPSLPLVGTCSTADCDSVISHRVTQAGKDLEDDQAQPLA